MEFEVEYKPGWVEIRTRGKASLEGFRVMAETVSADPNWVPGIDVLVDHSALDVTEMDQRNVTELGRRADKQHPLASARRVAFFTPSDLQFGVGRMWQAHAREDHILARVFNSRDEAIAWLKSEDDE